MTQTRAFWSTSLVAIYEYLEAGNYKAASPLLFDQQTQHYNRSRLEFWHAQILVAAIEGRGYHLAFLTGAIAFGKSAFTSEIKMKAMLEFFDEYAALPSYRKHRKEIRQLIRFYEDWQERRSQRPPSQPRNYRPMSKLVSDLV